MLIYSHNLAEKLFGFAQSRDFLKYNTDLCGILEDPNLQTDIDLAIDLHKADRGDEEAARRLTNTLILSSAFIDMSTKNFYAFKMSTRPVFTSHINRINLTFSAISLGQTSILNDLKASGDDEDGFIDKLLDALKDCLNSPCNLFAQSSDSVASLAKVANTQNINAIPSFSEIKDQFTHTFEGIDHTLFKKLPKSIKSNAIKMGQLCQKAWGESMDMFFEKDKDARKKIIEKAQSGDALDFEDEGFRYVPDLDNYLNANKMASNILSKVAGDLGGCFDGFQQSYRYDPYSADYNLAVTSNRPTKNKVNDTDFEQNLLGQPVYDQETLSKERNLGVDSVEINCEAADAGGNSERDNWIANQKNIRGRSPNGINLTSYGQSNDSTPDSNTMAKRGFSNNLLREGSVALSPDIYNKYNPEIGSAVYVDGNLIGYYEDRTPSSYNGKSYYNTVDVYDPSGTVGPILKNSGSGNISFGPARPQISNP